MHNGKVSGVVVISHDQCLKIKTETDVVLPCARPCRYPQISLPGPVPAADLHGEAFEVHELSRCRTFRHSSFQVITAGVKRLLSVNYVE